LERLTVYIYCRLMREIKNKRSNSTNNKAEEESIKNPSSSAEGFNLFKKYDSESGKR
jgi:hypothetical protein